LRLAFPLITSETFIAMNGDSFCDVNLTDLWEWHQARQANTTMVLTSKPDTARYGRVSLSADGIISDFEEKESTTGKGWVNAGIYVFDSEMVRAIPQGRAVSLEHEVFPSLVGQRLYGYKCQGRFLDIGTPESYAQADALFALDRK
jgi:D-glycero-alpha-D-manno-heptose 1-phosphate guanylyltransferase